jgi:hypothetical protein
MEWKKEKKEQKSEVEMKNETFFILLQRKTFFADKEKRKNQFINGFNISEYTTWISLSWFC